MLRRILVILAFLFGCFILLTPFLLYCGFRYVVWGEPDHLMNGVDRWMAWVDRLHDRAIGKS